MDEHRLRIDLAPHHHKLLDMTIPQVLDFAAQTWPERTAVKIIEERVAEYSWARLRTTVDHMRSGLHRAGVAPGDKVGLLLANGMAFPLSWLAIIDAGAVAVPMNRKYTAAEVEFVLTDADARWFITTDEATARLSVGGQIGPVPLTRVIAEETESVGHHFADLLAAPVTDRIHVAHPHDVANIQFTSGTTGLPKGCLLTHEYWIDFGVYSSALFDQPQRLLAGHPFYYMQNQAYFWIALAGGGAVYVTSGLSRRKYMGRLVDHDIDFAGVDDHMLDTPEMPTDKHLHLKKARFDLQAREWYASTEAGNGTFVPWERDDLVGVETIGLAGPTRESKIIDETGQEVAPGVEGELCLRGRGMMLGYHNRPETNAELMLPGGWYRTGDLVRKDANGLHYFVGRLKDMVKRSGENISCAEVELRIQSMPEVSEVGVVPVLDRERGEEVMAIIVLNDEAHLTAEQVQEWCRKALTAFKIPRYVEFRDTLPHTPSGKIAKAVLRAEADQFGAAVVDLRPPVPAARP